MKTFLILLANGGKPQPINAEKYKLDQSHGLTRYVLITGDREVASFPVATVLGIAEKEAVATE